MPEIKRDCFAHFSDNYHDGCYCLERLFCKKENCKFYQQKQKAKEKYLNNYTMATANLIARSVDKHFRDL